MMMPSIFGERLFDDLFDEFDREFTNKKNPLYGKHSKNMMKTDVKETENQYEVDVDLPGFKKDEISVALDDGYLTISTQKAMNRDEKDKDGQFIRHERYEGSMSRSFYVGESVTHEEIGASYEDGVLKLLIPKKTKVIENKKYIEIE